MSSTRAAGARQNSKTENKEPLSLDDKINKPRRATEEDQKTKTTKPTDPRDRDSATFLGAEAWCSQFPTNEFEITDSSFMDQLEKGLTKAQVERLTEDIKKALANKKEEFCSGNYTSSSNAKTRLANLMTQIVMEEASFVIDEVLEDCKRQHAELKIEKDQVAQHSSYIDLRKKENNKLKEENKIATREFTAILQKWVENLSDEEEGEVGITTLQESSLSS